MSDSLRALLYLGAALTFLAVLRIFAMERQCRVLCWHQLYIGANIVEIRRKSDVFGAVGVAIRPVAFSHFPVWRARVI